MKNNFILLSAVVMILFAPKISGQCKPILKVDGIATVIDENDTFGLKFPYWLKEGQTVAVGSSVKSVSIIEFNVVGNALEFSQVINLTSTSPVTVPDNTVWKLESALKENNSSSYRSVTFTTPGTYSWTTPSCSEQICVELWGAGGGGAGGVSAGTASQRRPGGGGGGGGFGSECFAVSPNSTLSVVVGAGGRGGDGAYQTITSTNYGSAGGSSSVGSLITAYGGSGGLVVLNSNSAGGAGGSATSASKADGATGGNGTCNGCPTGVGGAGGNGGAGGPSITSSANGLPGQAPGGGGSGGSSDGYNGGAGGAGKVTITW